MSNPLGKPRSIREAIEHARAHLAKMKADGARVSENTENATISLFVQDWIANQLHKKLLGAPLEELDAVMKICEALGFMENNHSTEDSL